MRIIRIVLLKSLFLALILLSLSHLAISQSGHKSVKKNNVKIKSNNKSSKKVRKYTVFYTKNGHKVAIGLASYYSRKFNGHKTSSGEIYNENLYTAASNVFPLNTKVWVINVKTKDSLQVKINDRMHPSMLNKGRVIDLSFIAAQTLNFIEQGLLKVKVISEKKIKFK